MSHECPNCGQECYCDGEDHHQDAPDDCCHDCDLDDEEFLTAPYTEVPTALPQSHESR